jgi:hypothetical protein
MDKAIRDQIISIIDDVDDMTIATVREDGYPQASTVRCGRRSSGQLSVNVGFAA